MLLGHVPECGLWQWCIGGGWSPFRVAKLGEGVGRAGCEGLSREGTGSGGELTEVDERRCASGPRSVAGCVTASRVRRWCGRGGSFMQQRTPIASVEAGAASVELFGRQPGFARRAEKQHTRRQAEQLPSARFVAITCRVQSKSQAGTQCGAEGTPDARRGRLQRKDALPASGLEVNRIKSGKAEAHAGFSCSVDLLASCAGRAGMRLLCPYLGTGFGRASNRGFGYCSGGGAAPTPSPAAATPSATPRCRSARAHRRCG